METERYAVTATGRIAILGAEIFATGTRFISADLCVGDEALALVAGQDIVVHCAALSSPWGRFRDFHAANVEATRNVIRACLASGVRRLVHLSTPSIYYDGRPRRGLTEEAPVASRFVNSYTATKWTAECEVLNIPASHLETIVLRPRAVYGKYDRAIVPRIRNVAQRGVFPLIDGGSALVDVTSVNNVARAVIAAIEAPSGALGRAYNITDGEPVKVLSLLNELFSGMGLSVRYRKIPLAVARIAGTLSELAYGVLPGSLEPPITRYTLAVMGLDQTFNITAARHEIGYEPVGETLCALHECGRWWRAQND